MQWFSFAVAFLVALAIIGIGVGYLTVPRKMAPSFGLPPPEGGEHTTWWLRLKGVRDITSGVMVLAFLMYDRHWALGLVLLVQALSPLGDMSLVMAGKGKIATALGVHGVTSAVMIMAAIPLLMGAK